MPAAKLPSSSSARNRRYLTPGDRAGPASCELWSKMPDHRSDEPATSQRDQQQVTVLAVDDQEGFLLVARALVRATPGFALAALARSGEEAITLVDQLEPNLVLMDARMPGIGGIEATRHIVDHHANTVVVLISIDDVDALPRSARTCGAAAIVKKVDLRPSTLRELWDEH
jgi:two-component system invasion response regulator UvrY